MHYILYYLIGHLDKSLKIGGNYKLRNFLKKPCPPTPGLGNKFGTVQQQLKMKVDNSIKNTEIFWIDNPDYSNQNILNNPVITFTQQLSFKNNQVFFNLSNCKNTLSINFQ